MKKIKNLCKGCNSIVDIKPIMLGEEFDEYIKNIKENIKDTIKGLNRSINKLSGKRSFYFNIIHTQSACNFIKIKDIHLAVLEDIKKYGEYTHYYNCPHCDEINYLKLK